MKTKNRAGTEGGDRGARRSLTRALALTVMTLVAMFTAVAPASAHEGDHWWPTDGCTAVPDLYFNHACVHHDGCYAYHWSDRGTCDQWFLNDMLGTCRTLPFDLVTGCVGTAYLYYGGVRAFGGPFYDHPDIATRIRTPMA
jgi:hypothetical protein